jgi:uncharacterized protein (TIGR01777 family)
VSTILIGGASGFIGSRLAQLLQSSGHRIARLVRRPRASVGADTVHWVPEAAIIDRDALARVQPDVVINLAGEPIAQRWTAKAKARIYDSRVKGTTALASALARLSNPPAAFVSGSAIGYYGAHRGDEQLDEESQAGSDYLAETAQAWERSTESAAAAGIRVVTLRTGVVLGRDGGALARLLLPFRLGLGGRIGGGRQWMSWISLEDAVRAIHFAVEATELRGPVNVVAPTAVRNAEFTAVLARVLRRPAFLPVPGVALETFYGSMATNTILADQRVVPKRLAGAGFAFRHPRLEEALRFELRRSNDPDGR